MDCICFLAFCLLCSLFFPPFEKKKLMARSDPLSFGFCSHSLLEYAPRVGHVQARGFNSYSSHEKLRQFFLFFMFLDCSYLLHFFYSSLVSFEKNFHREKNIPPLFYRNVSSSCLALSILCAFYKD